MDQNFASLLFILKTQGYVAIPQKFTMQRLQHFFTFNNDFLQKVTEIVYNKQNLHLFLKFVLLHCSSSECSDSTSSASESSSSPSSLEISPGIFAAGAKNCAPNRPSLKINFYCVVYSTISTFQINF